MASFKKIQYGLFIASGFLVLAGPVFAQVTTEVPLPSIEGTEPFRGPAQYVAYIFRFSLGIAAALAFAMIVVGGIQIALSGGNVSQVEDGKDRIRMAILGLLLLLFSILILRTIGISAISNPPLPSASIPPTPTGSPSPSPPPPPLPGGTLSLNGAGITCVGRTSCTNFPLGDCNTPLASSLISALLWLESRFPDQVVVTSAVCGSHVRGSFHYRGQAVDLSLSGLNDAVIRGMLETLGASPCVDELFGPDRFGVLCRDRGVPINCGSIPGHEGHIHFAVRDGC